MRQSSLCFLQIVFFISCFSSGCSRFANSSSVEVKENHSHRVQYQGESLALIAGWYTGNTKNWETLAKYNNLTTPKKIEMGQVILIPTAMLTRFEAMPESIIERKKIIVKKNTTTKVKTEVIAADTIPTTQKTIVKSATLKNNKETIVSEVKTIDKTVVENAEEKNTTITKASETKTTESHNPKISFEEKLKKLEIERSLRLSTASEQKVGG